MKKTDKKIALSFRGGGARRTAYLGVLKALEKNNIPIHGIIAGSAGALIGTAYATGNGIDDILVYSKQFSLRKVLNHKFWEKPFSIADNQKFRKVITDYVGEADLKDCDLDLYIEATNYSTGEQKIFDQGNIGDILVASCAAPLFLKPVKIGKSRYYDGDIDHSIHTKFIKKRGYDVILAFSADRSKTAKSPFVRSIDVLEDKITEMQLKYEKPDIFLGKLGGDVGFLQFDRYMTPYRIAYRKTLQIMPEIKKVVFS